MSAIADRGYRHPSALVSTEWVAAHAGDPGVRIIESNEDTLLYATGHVPGAVHVDWTADLNDQLRRDYIERAGFADADGEDRRHPRHHRRLLRRQEQLVGLLRLLGVPAVRPHQGPRDGRRPAQVAEGRAPLVHRRAEVPGDDLHGAGARRRADPRILRDEVIQYQKTGGQFVDVRSPEEYTGDAHAHARVPERRRAPRRPHSRARRASRGPARSTPTTAPSRPPTS